MLIAHDPYVINLDEVEAAQVGRDCVNLLMTNGAKITFPSMAEDVIDAVRNLRHLTIGSTWYFVRNISVVKCSSSMALLQMKSGLQGTLRGEEAIRDMFAILSGAFVQIETPEEPEPPAPEEMRAPDAIGKARLREAPAPHKRRAR